MAAAGVDVAIMTKKPNSAKAQSIFGRQFMGALLSERKRCFSPNNDESGSPSIGLNNQFLMRRLGWARHNAEKLGTAATLLIGCRLVSNYQHGFQEDS